MCHLCDKTIEAIWKKIEIGQSYKTPDLYKGADFNIINKDSNSIKINKQNIVIAKTAFVEAIHYLRSNGHNMASPCLIKSSNARATAGPLCISTRDKNVSKRRCINYILPILQRNAIVGVNPTRPNTTWLLAL